MLRRLKKGEMGNFGGIEWRWRDGPENDGLGSLAGVAYFLREPDASLKRYTQDRLFVAAQGDFSRVEQEAVARKWAETIGREFASEGFGNMSVPWLSIALPEKRFEALRREKGWEIPANLLLRFNAYAEPDLPQMTGDVRSDIRYFAASDRIAGATPDIATYDAIVLRDGCFFIDEAGDDDPLAMFGIGTGVYRDSEGHMAFRSRYSNYQPRLARVGTRMQLGYRSEVANPPAELIEACGDHRVVLVKSLDQAAGYGGDWFAVKQYARHHGLSDADAMKQVNDCLVEQEQVMADRRLRGSAVEPQPCPQAVRVMPRPPAPPGTESRS
ncbi:hypothetical protein [Erythrobacter aureus]|uniref:hypothetical protein n=1 Tax=Erythrobacter aureus TaxID=2182384 RepID=UPI003A91AB49